MKLFLLIFYFSISLFAMGQNDQSKTDWANLQKYAAENTILLKNVAINPRIVFMGNSITEFWKYSDSSFFIGNTYINRGISGQTTPQMLIRFRPDVIMLKPAVVVILAGINDIAENTGPITLEAIFGNIVSMAQLARANKIKVVLSSVLPASDFPWRPGSRPAEKIIQLNAMIESYCTLNKIIYVNYYSNMVNEIKGLDKKYSNDGVHPNYNGYKLMEPLIQKAIRRALKQKK